MASMVDASENMRMHEQNCYLIYKKLTWLKWVKNFVYFFLGNDVIYGLWWRTCQKRIKEKFKRKGDRSFWPKLDDTATNSLTKLCAFKLFRCHGIRFFVSFSHSILLNVNSNLGFCGIPQQILEISFFFFLGFIFSFILHINYVNGQIYIVMWVVILSENS